MRGFNFVMKRGVIEREFTKAITQLLVIPRIGRKQRAKYHRHRGLKPIEHIHAGFFIIGNRVTNFGFGDVLNGGGNEAHFTRAKRVQHFMFRGKDTDAVNLTRRAVRHKLNLLTFA